MRVRVAAGTLVSEIECDVLIIGSGVGALTAAIAARSAGLATTLVERKHRIGSSTMLSGGVMWLPNNPLMIRERIHDSRDAALNYLANFVDDHTPGTLPARREAFVDGVTAMIALLEAQGIPLRRCEGYADYHDRLPGGHAQGRVVEAQVFDTNRLGPWRKRLWVDANGSLARDSELASLTQGGASLEARAKALQLFVRKITGRIAGRSLVSGGAALQGNLLCAALDLGCSVHTDAGLVELCRNTSRVDGAIIDFNGWHRRIHARVGVIVAPGETVRRGKAAQIDARPCQSDPAQEPAASIDTNHAISAMTDIGAITSTSGQSWWATGFAVPVPSSHGHDRAISCTPLVQEFHKPHLIIVDQTGRRFVNEAASMMQVGRACIERNATVAALPAWAIFDTNHRRRYAFGSAAPGHTPRSWLKAGTIYRHADLDGLARECGIDPAGLEATVTRWNTLARHGRDEDFGKGASAYNRYFGDPAYTPNPCMGPIMRPPFYAVPIRPGELGSCDGVISDQHGRVLAADGTPIAGLYAAGNSVAPLTGPNYVAPGQSLGVSAVFGMIAVRHMVR